MLANVTPRGDENKIDIANKNGYVECSCLNNDFISANFNIEACDYLCGSNLSDYRLSATCIIAISR
jgi:hypothetical protein